jgi:hypothetical protein
MDGSIDEHKRRRLLLLNQWSPPHLRPRPSAPISRLAELVTWRRLVGDPSLIDAPAECDERELDALPLPAREPAERWQEKNPLDAYRDIIRV